MHRLRELLTNALWVLLALICLGFTAVGAYGVLKGDSRGWLPLIFFGLCSVLYIGGLVRRTKSDSRTMSPAEQAAFQEQLAREKKVCAELVEKFSLPSCREEPLPPWIEFPGIHSYHIFWRMGPGESYLISPFGEFWRDLDQEQREAYFARYDLGETWPHRDSWYDGWVDIEPD